ncbi:MAG: hypothetical protein ACRCZP_19955 [Phycicoccus sp.]
MTIRLAYNVTGQTLRHSPPTQQASVIWTLEDLRYDDDNAARTLDSGTAAVDTATEVTIAIAGPGQANPRLLDVASTAGFAVSTDRARTFYEIVDAQTGEREPLEVDGIDTNDALIAKHPLTRAYAVGSTIRGLTHVTADIDAAVLQDEQRVMGDWPMRVLWVYPDGSRHQEQVRLVRDTESDLFVTAIRADMLDVFPDIDTRMSYQGRDTLAPHIRTSIRQIRAELLSKSMLLEEHLAGDQIHWHAVWRTLKHLAMLGNIPANVDARDFKEYVAGEASRTWDALTIGSGGTERLKTEPVSGTAAAEAVEYRPLFMPL